MKIFLDYLCIICFFVAFKIWGVYVATGVSMGVLLLQVLLTWIIKRHVEKAHLITLALLLIFGGSTLLFHNPVFIKWKPSAVYWLFFLALVLSPYVSKGPLIKRVLGNALTLPETIWRQLNLAWALFFLVLGGLNLFVALHYSTSTWVNFKLFGTLGATLAFCLLQSLYISKYLPKEETSK